MDPKAKHATSKKAKLQTKSSKIEALAVIRRSRRLRNPNPPSGNQEIQPFFETNMIEDDTSFVMNDGEDPMPRERSLEDKVDSIHEAVDKLKSKASESPQDNIPTTDLNFKKLYFDAQKKIEKLMEDNYELSKKLEVAQGKLKAHSVTNRVWSEALEQVKDVFMLPDLPKATQKNKSLSSLSKEIGEPNGAGQTQLVLSKKRKQNEKSN